MNWYHTFDTQTSVRDFLAHSVTVAAIQSIKFMLLSSGDDVIKWKQFPRVTGPTMHGTSMLESLNNTDSKVHGANMGPIRGRQDPGGPHAGLVR